MSSPEKVDVVRQQLFTDETNSIRRPLTSLPIETHTQKIDLELYTTFLLCDARPLSLPTCFGILYAYFHFFGHFLVSIVFPSYLQNIHKHAHRTHILYNCGVPKNLCHSEFPRNKPWRFQMDEKFEFKSFWKKMRKAKLIERAQRK